MPSTSVPNNLTQSLLQRNAEQLRSAKGAPSHRTETSSLADLVIFTVFHVTKPWQRGLAGTGTDWHSADPLPSTCPALTWVPVSPPLLWPPSCKPGRFSVCMKNVLQDSPPPVWVCGQHILYGSV